MARVFSRSRLRGTALSVLACGVLSACIIGGQTSGDTPSPEQECPHREQQLAWEDASSLLLFAPEEARAVVVGEHVASFRWDDANPAYSSEPEHGESQIVIDVAPPTELPKLIVEPSCTFYLSFESTVTVTTAGGALLEQLQGKFKARNRSLVELRAVLPLDQLTGSLTITPKDGAAPTLFRVQGVFKDGKTSGFVSVSSNSAELGPGLGCWPSDNSCGSLL